MNTHAERIAEAFRRNRIERVLVIDDAYDPPPIDEDTIAALADIFAGGIRPSVRSDMQIDPETFAAAADAAHAGDLENDDLDEVYRALYRLYTVTRDEAIDPRERFQTRKGRALDELSPLLCLLQKCGDRMDVCTAGLSDASSVYHQRLPQLVFLDYYLDSSSGDPEYRDEAALAAARFRSLDFLQELIGRGSIENLPAVVLISTQQVSDVDEYRHAVPGHAMMALRFGFLQKRQLRDDEGVIQIGHEAADALLDTSQGYLLGRAVQCGLHGWKMGAQTAIETFVKEINDLQTKDFAYLLRFRLRDEAQPLDDYLMWLFGESLRGLIDNSVDWPDSFRNLDEEIHASIEGALEGRTPTIARIFHRARVNTHRIRSWRDYQLGDLFVKLEEHQIFVVITPDCDLVSRHSSPNAKRVLTMRGTVRTFDQTKSAADDFLIIHDRAHSVLWDPKDLQTFPITDGGGLRQSHEFIGTLRPLYAQEIQRRAIADLSRVGLPVAPALGIRATASVWIRKKGGAYQEIVMESIATTVVPERSGKQGGHRVLTARPFVHELLDKLRSWNTDELNIGDKNSLRRLLAHDGEKKLYDALSRDGIRPNPSAFLGVGVFFGEETRRGNSAPWLQILIDVSRDMQADFHIEDPLVG